MLILRELHAATQALEDSGYSWHEHRLRYT